MNLGLMTAMDTHFWKKKLARSLTKTKLNRGCCHTNNRGGLHSMMNIPGIVIYHSAQIVCLSLGKFLNMKGTSDVVVRWPDATKGYTSTANVLLENCCVMDILSSIYWLCKVIMNRCAKFGIF